MNTLVLKSQSGKLITFANFVDMSVEPTVSAIHHENKMKSIIVTAYLEEPDVRGTTTRVTNKLKAINLPIGVDWEITGGTAEMMESFRTLLFAILIAVFSSLYRDGHTVRAVYPTPYRHGCNPFHRNRSNCGTPHIRIYTLDYLVYGIDCTCRNCGEQRNRLD